MASLDFRILRQEGGKAQLGESPCWDPGSNDLWSVDVTGKQILRADTLSGEVQAWETPECLGFVVLTAPSRPVVGMQTGIFAFDPESSSFERLVPFDQPGCRFNDAAVDQRGRLWASTMAMDAQAERGAVHLITQDLKLDTVVQGLTIPNGLALDLERGRLFYSDSHPAVQSIWTRPLKPDPGQLGEASLFTTTKELAGRPDGAALDQQGFYWIAGVDGSELYVFGIDAALHTTLPVPFSAPTKVSFSGPAGRSIAITSKTDEKDGGYIGLANLPTGMTPGIAQPYWNPDA